MGHSGLAIKLGAIGAAGQGVTYLLAVILARRLGVDGFEAYAVASAAFGVMLSFAPRGIEKYTLRLLPALVARADWSTARGFLRYGLRRTLGTAMLAGLAVGTWVWARGASDGIRLAVLVSCVSLPSGALASYGMEVLSALGREATALLLIRVAVPLATLVLIGILFALQLNVSGATAVGCWGVAGTLVLALMALQIRRAAPPEIFGAKRIEEASKWRLEARPFFFYRVAHGLLGQAGVIALDWLQPSAAAVGAYAAAMGTVSLMAVLATATNRVYARRLSILLERRDFAAIRALRGERARWLLPAIAVCLLVAFAFTRELLSLFRPEFVNEGIVPLRLLAAATAFTVFFALAPTYLKYRRHNRAIFVILAVATAAQLTMLLSLIPRYGAAGAALAYAASMCGLYGAFAWMARRELARTPDALAR